MKTWANTQRLCANNPSTVATDMLHMLTTSHLLVCDYFTAPHRVRVSSVPNHKKLNTFDIYDSTLGCPWRMSHNRHWERAVHSTQIFFFFFYKTQQSYNSQATTLIILHIGFSAQVTFDRLSFSEMGNSYYTRSGCVVSCSEGTV